MAKSRTRKKAITAETTSPESPVADTAAPDVFDEQIEARKREAAQQAAAVVHQLPAEHERAAAHEHGHEHSHAARHTPPATASGEHGDHQHAHRHHQHREEGQSHADSVGKRERRPRYANHGQSDDTIGAHRTEHIDPYYSIIRFDEKPSDQVREKMRDAGFDWSQPNKEWKRYINYETKEQDREHARQTFTEVCKMIRTERGINHDVGLPR